MDAGWGRALKVLARKNQDEWLLLEDNLNKWNTNDFDASDRRILITQWFGKACETLCENGMNDFRVKFWKCTHYPKRYTIPSY